MFLTGEEIMKSGSKCSEKNESHIEVSGRFTLPGSSNLTEEVEEMLRLVGVNKVLVFYVGGTRWCFI